MTSTQQISRGKKWEVLHRTSITDRGIQAIVDVLLKNRGIKTKKEKEEFFRPTPPEKISLRKLGIKATEVNRAVKRLSKARAKKEKVIVFGDYDADGVCSTAILWECLYSLGLDALPYIPERFSEGYGLKADSIKKLKKEYPKLELIITVDNGIVAYEAVNAANKLGIDVIITDHHLKGKKLPKAHSIIHTTEIGGAGLAWILSREILTKLQPTNYNLQTSLELAAIGTVADQLPLIGANRSFAKYGIEALNKTERPGLLALFEESGIKKKSSDQPIGTYEVNFIIAPRINAMGRMMHAIDSLRLLCTKSRNRAKELAYLLAKTNVARQKIVEDVVEHARNSLKEMDAESEGKGVIVLHHESYHEGVIGLAASRLVGEFYRPAIVISRGETHSKASARSIPGFNIIEALRELDDMLVDGGGHPMAAGFTLETKQLGYFTKKIEKVSAPLLTEDLLAKKLKIDLELDFTKINWDLLKSLKKFEPAGIGNPTPTFVSRTVSVLNSRVVGSDRRHLKLTVEQNDKVFDAIAFGFGDYYAKLSPGIPIDLVYRLEENLWNGKRSLQLKIKDIKSTK